MGLLSPVTIPESIAAFISVPVPFTLKWRTMLIPFLLFGNSVISFESRSLILCIYTSVLGSTKSIQEQIMEYDVKVEIPKNTRPSIK